MFEIQLIDPMGVESRKSVVFQAKDRTTRINQRLIKQARQVATLPGGGIVIDYGTQSYSAVDAASVSDGHRDALENGTSLEVVPDAFVVCKIGSAAYYYDAVTESIIILAPGGRVPGP